MALKRKLKNQTQTSNSEIDSPTSEQIESFETNENLPQKRQKLNENSPQKNKKSLNIKNTTKNNNRNKKEVIIVHDRIDNYTKKKDNNISISKGPKNINSFTKGKEDIFANNNENNISKSNKKQKTSKNESKNNSQKGISLNVHFIYYF